MVEGKEIKLKEYLDNLAKNNNLDEESKKVLDGGYKELSEEDQTQGYENKKMIWATFKIQGQLTSVDPNPFSPVALLIASLEGWTRQSFSTGKGSLKFSDGTIVGRPSFPQFTQEHFQVKAGQHRRHILAWHTIRGFHNLMLASKKGELIEKLKKHSDLAPKEVTAEAKKHFYDNWTLVSCFIMNGNIQNLWVGKGSINSAINTAEHILAEKLAEATTPDDLEILAADLKNRTGQAIYSTATTLAADIILAGLKVDSSVEDIKSEVTEWVLENLSVDAYGDKKKLNEEFWKERGKRIELAAQIEQIVAKGDASSVDDEMIKMLMTYKD